MIKTLIVATFGESDRNGVTRHGKLTSVGLAQKLIGYVDGRSTMVFYSTNSGAVNSAEIIWNTLAISGGVNDIETFPALVLQTSRGQQPSNEAIFDLVAKKAGEAEVVILVTHKDVCYEFPQFYAATALHVELRNMELEESEAVVLDCERGTAELVKWV